MLLLGSDHLINLISLISPLVWLRSVDLCILHAYLHHSSFILQRSTRKQYMDTWILMPCPVCQGGNASTVVEQEEKQQQSFGAVVASYMHNVQE